MSSTMEIVQQGWLTKSPPAKAIFRPRWQRRWFILRAGTFPNQFVLEYFTDESCRRPKGYINLDECEQIAAPLSVQDRHKFTFDLRTPGRTYYLAADSEAEMNKWVSCLCQVCGLKTNEDENEMYTKPVNENNRPVNENNRRVDENNRRADENNRRVDENNRRVGEINRPVDENNRPVDENSRPEPEENHDQNESDESSPTLSARVPSGPYIPISECFTGQPILFNDKPNGQDATYCNTTSFPFPPKVNWATHPAKKEPTESEATVVTPSGGGGPVAPPRPPKKAASVAVTIAVASPQPVTETLKSVPLPSGTRSVFHYDNFEEAHDSSSTCSSLHSPPGSAGVLYSNISEISDLKAPGPIYQNPANLVSACHTSQMNPLPSPGEQNLSGSSPPKVNRNLKPDLRKISEVNPRIHQSPTHKFLTNKHSSGAMTLPTRNNHRQPGVVGPAIDRSRKPSDSPITLAPTPAQLKGQSGNQISSRQYMGSKSSISTLPTSPRRRAGPIISPHDKKPPVYHEYEQATELQGTYLQIDCKNLEGDVKPHNNSKVTQHKKILGGTHSEDSGSVEYRLIDHVKTKALNQMRQDREEQLRTNTVSKNLN